MYAVELIRKIDRYYQELSNHEKIPAKWILRCGAIADYMIWGTSFSEYFGYRFWTRSAAEKKEYMTRRHMFRFYDQYCDKAYRNRIGDKSITKQYYGRFMDRHQFDYAEGYEAFAAFCRKHPHIFIKKRVGWGGENARCEHITDAEKCMTVWESIDESFLVEERLQNCAEIKKIWPDAPNTIKGTTLIVEGKPEIQHALIRFGNNTAVDNIHLGGLFAPVDIATGVVRAKALDRSHGEYAKHPVTHMDILGFQVPQWDDVVQLVTEAAGVTPQLRYASWDIAVTDRGVLLIEGNWDAEFYASQGAHNRGLRKMMVEKLERGNERGMA